MSAFSRYSDRRRYAVAVIGGGVIGLACARALQRRGAHVVVFEQGKPGQGASARAAGMLGATFESASDPSGATLLALTLRSMELWPAFAAELSSNHAAGIGYRRGGAVCVALNEAEAVQLSRFGARCRSLGLEAETLSPSELLRTTPDLVQLRHPAWVLPTEGSVDPPALLAALAIACVRDGVSLRCGQKVEGVRTRGRQVEVAGDLFDAMLLATGATAQLQFQDDRGRPVDTGLPTIVPVKGQMLAVSAEGLRLDTVVHGAGVYVVPQGEKILIGATVERGVADLVVDPVAIEGLHARAMRLVPGLASAARISAWAGVRPASPDGLPHIGETRIPQIFAALGHYRHGIRLAPGTAEAIADLVVGGQAPAYVGPCDPLRFDNPVAASQSR
jgi:glycine oxidase